MPEHRFKKDVDTLTGALRVGGSLLKSVVGFGGPRVAVISVSKTDGILFVLGRNAKTHTILPHGWVHLFKNNRF